jgi:HAE1 family hydrophobic/amphiphilic exporter-1
MNYRQSWIEKPRRVFLLLIFLCVLIVLFAASVSLGYLPRSQNRSISVTIECRGAYAEEIERTILDPLEANIAHVAGIIEIFSVADRGKARLIITFSSDTDLDTAFLSVREVVCAAYTDFPTKAQRPVILKSDPLGQPVFIAGFPIAGELSEEDLKRIFENVEGSGEIEITGGYEPEVVVEYDPQKLSVSHFVLEDLIKKIRAANIVGGFGLENGESHILDSRFLKPEQLLDLPISAGVKLRNLATVGIEKRRTESLGRVDGIQRLIVYVQPTGDANLLALCNRLEGLTENLPAGESLYSYGRLVRKALEQILFAVSAGICFVVLLTILFLGRLFPAIMISANIPFSVLVSLAMLRVTGEELNIVTLSGIAVGVGLVIDAGVIFVEEYFQSSMNYRKAVMVSRGPILFAAATTVAVFLPLFFAPSVLVHQFKGLAVSVTGSVAASCLFVFLFLPTFLHWFYRTRRAVFTSTGRQGLRILKFDRGKGAILGCVRALVSIMNRNRWPISIAAVVTICTLFIMAFGSERRQTGNTGLQDEVIHFAVEYPSGYTKEFIVQAASSIERTLLAYRGVDRVSSRYERERAVFYVQTAEAVNTGQFVAFLREQEDTLGEGFLHFPDGTTEGTSFTLTLSGPSLDELKRLAVQLSQDLHGLQGTKGIVFHFKDVLPARTVHVDLTKVAQAGLDPRQLYSQMYWALSAPVVDKWTTGREEMDVVLQSKNLKEDERSVKMLLQLPSRAGALPVGSLVHVTDQQQSGRIYHLNRSRSLSLSIQTDWGSRAKLLRTTRKILESFPFPPEYWGDIGREVGEEVILAKAVLVSLGLAVLLIFFILMFQFESIRISGIILLQIPFSFVCPLLALRAISWAFTSPVIIGLILTSGIAVNNAILVFVDLRAGRVTVERVYKVLVKKLRPLVVSSLTTIAGVIPLLLWGKAGRGILAPLSLTVAMGITGSLVALVVTLSVVAVRE